MDWIDVVLVHLPLPANILHVHRSHPFSMLRVCPLPPSRSRYAKLNDAATESELYAFVMRSYRRFEQAVYGAAYSRDATSSRGEGLGDIELRREGEGVSSRAIDPSDEVLEAMLTRIKDEPCQYERLKDAVDR